MKVGLKKGVSNARFPIKNSQVNEIEWKRDLPGSTLRNHF